MSGSEIKICEVIVARIKFCRKHDGKLSRFLVWSVLLHFFMVLGCGSDLQSKYKGGLDKLATNLFFASQVAGDQVSVVPGSYMVAFKDRYGGLVNQQGSFRRNAQQYSLALDAELSPVSYKDMYYISHLKLSGKPSRNPGFPLQPYVYDQHLSQENRIQGDSDIVLFKVDFRDEQQAVQSLTQWQAAGMLYYAEPNYLNQLHGIFADSQQEYTNSGVFSNWWHAQIHTYEAFGVLESRQQGERNSDAALLNTPPVIAVMDSGVDVNHPMLAGKIWNNSKRNAAGCVEDEYGCNTTVSTKGYLGIGNVNPYATKGHGQECPADPKLKGVCLHGTHVSGIVAANPGNGIGGVCPICQIMVLRVVKEEDGGIPDHAILNALKYLSLFRRNNVGLVRVVNASLGKFQRSLSVGLMVRLLKNLDPGILVIGAAGNEDSMKRSYPAAFNDAIAVSAVDVKLRKAYYSNFGPWVDVASPGGGDGGQINSTIPGGQTAGSQGTSMAAPVVSGMAGLLLAQNPGVSLERLRALIVNSSNGNLYSAANEDLLYNRRNYFKRFVGSRERIPLLGSGLIDAEAALNGQRQALRTKGVKNRVTGCSVAAGIAIRSQLTGTSSPDNMQNSWLIALLLGFPLWFGIYSGILHRRRR